ncbi:hypothetical protein MLD38_036485 [Melastoma candidum]|uniref:Uncharacterized protein n=1 Tax=Melastoma candidum TaxID=119954 RepID=A0ACB9LK99_9MYRT|nr:hypothetical protein MLD38_036485 [Melastoma candidum]
MSPVRVVYWMCCTHRRVCGYCHSCTSRTHTPDSVQEIWSLATQPDKHAARILGHMLVDRLIHGMTFEHKSNWNSIKLTLEGISQVYHPQTWLFVTVEAVSVITQLNYLNKALDTFSAAMVSPVYYVMFTTLTVVASAIMFKDWSGQTASSLASELCGFITVLSGTVILHATREQEPVLP